MAWLVAGLAAIVGAFVLVRAPWSTDDAPPPIAAPAPTFVDETSDAGVEHAYSGEFEFFVGGGVAAFDCDEDGRADLFFAGGSEPSSLFRNQSTAGGALRFRREASPVTDVRFVTGAYPIDIDGDEHDDLVVLRRGGNVVLRGLGNCGFEQANDDWGIDGGDEWTTAFSATWEGSNALPTLAFGTYLVPDQDVCGDNQLLRPASTGERYAAPVPLQPSHCTLSVLFSDWSRSGRRDLRVANDRHYYTDGSDQLWHIAPGEPPREFDAADGWRPLRIWGMGIASQDLTGDGYPEVFITSQGDNKLQTLAEGPETPTFRDIALRRGLTAQRPFTGGDVLPSTAWHPEFADVNNDGFVDLFVSKGNVEAQPDFASRDPSNLLIGQTDGSFVEGADAAGILSFDRARGAALVDLNLDGLLDLVVVNRRENVRLWRNVGTGTGQDPASPGGWIALRLKDAAPNVDAVGAWLEVDVPGRTTVREVTVGGGHAGGQTGWHHFGLGDADVARVRVRWPDGELGSWIPVEADRFVVVERGADEATAWSPAG